MGNASGTLAALDVLLKKNEPLLLDVTDGAGVARQVNIQGKLPGELAQWCGRFPAQRGPAYSGRELGPEFRGP